MYNVDGQLKTTTVAGNAITGVYAPDGSYNIVTNTAVVPVGTYHACGALNAFVTANTGAGRYAPNGSVNVIARAGGTVLIQPAGNGNFA